LEEIIGSNPEYVAAYYQLGILYQQTQQDDLAIKILQTGLELAKKQPGNLKTINEFRSLLDELLY
jgi:tetratricopeptide (TPR) repeat protein